MSRREGLILLSKAPSESAALDGHHLALLDSGYDILAAVLPELLSLQTKPLGGNDYGAKVGVTRMG